MKQNFFRRAALLLAILSIFSLTACSGDPSSLPESSAESSEILHPENSGSDESSAASTESESSALPESSTGEAAEITAEQAQQLAKERVPLDFTDGYRLTPEKEEVQLSGKPHYAFSVAGSEELTVLVSKENGSIFTRYADGTTYPLEEDPAFQITPSQWGGIYAAENGNVLTVELMDNNSFEFTLSAGDDVLEALSARISSESASQAEYIGGDGVRLRFSYLGGSIRITSEDSAGASYEGLYAPEH